MQKDRAIVFLAIGQTLTWAGLYYIFPALLLRWEMELGWSKIDITAAIALAVLISAAGSPLTGKIIDKGHGARLMTYSAIGGGIGLLLLSTVTALWQFYSVWAVIGAAFAGCLYEPCFALVTRARGKEAKHSIILITLVAGFASTITFPIMHTLSEDLGWRIAIRLFALAVILLAAPLLWLGAKKIENSVVSNTSAPLTPLTPLTPSTPSYRSITRNDYLQQPVFWYLAIGFALTALVHGSVLHHFLSILNDRGLTSEMAVLAASFIGPMQVAGRLAMMASEKYTSHHGIAMASFIVMGLSLVLLLFSDTSPVFLSAFVILFGGAYGTTSILRPLIARDLLGEQNFGAKSGALALPYLVGAALSPYLGSIIWGLGGYNTMLGSLIIISAIGCSMYAFANRLARDT